MRELLSLGIRPYSSVDPGIAVGSRVHRPTLNPKPPCHAPACKCRSNPRRHEELDSGIAVVYGVFFGIMEKNMEITPTGLFRVSLGLRAQAHSDV